MPRRLIADNIGNPPHSTGLQWMPLTPPPKTNMVQAKGFGTSGNAAIIGGRGDEIIQPASMHPQR